MNEPSLSGLELAADLPPLYLCGPIAEPGKPARGGFQACNRRTIEALRAVGIDVRPLPYPHPHARGVRKLLEYGAGFLRLFKQVLRCRSGAIVHITALSGTFMYLQWVLVRLARLRASHVVFDLRAGAVRRQYEQRSAVYRAAFRAALRSSDLIAVEGEELLGFVESASGCRPIHLPNHIDTRGIAPRPVQPLPQAPTVIYVGRVVAEKGLEVLLQACRAMHEAGVAAQVQIIGSGEPQYLLQLRTRFADLDVQWLGALPSAQVLAMWNRAHFFLFPTSHPGEGHSNALTEAMACGCVPIVSRHGFNEAVVGDGGVTLRVSATAADYAAQALSIWCGVGRWREFSGRAQRRVRASFATETVVQMLVVQYRRLVTR